MTTITDEELFAHAEGLKGKVLLITGGGKGIGQVGVSKLWHLGETILTYWLF